MLAAGLEPGYWSAVGQGVSAIALYTIVGVALVVLGFWVVGAARRAVDTRTFTRIYADLAVPVKLRVNPLTR